MGMMLGTRMDNRVEGVRGWGVPSESIFEVGFAVLDFTDTAEVYLDVHIAWSRENQIIFLYVHPKSIVQGRNASR